MGSRDAKGAGAAPDDREVDRRTRELFEQWRAGDGSAPARLFELHQRWLAALVEREVGAKLRTRIEPADVVQDVGVKLLHYEPKPEDGPLERFRALLRKMTRHVVTDLHRHHFEADKRNRGLEKSLPSDSHGGGEAPINPATSPSGCFQRNEDGALARIIVHFLPADLGDLIGLRSWLDVPFAVLSAHFDAEETALRMRHLRGMDKAASICAKVKFALPRTDGADRELISMKVERRLSFTTMALMLETTPVDACARFQQTMRKLGTLIEEPFRPLPEDWPHGLLGESA
jgi:RNA polymerase sigma-70 factor (ECF subfamily)